MYMCMCICRPIYIHVYVYLNTRSQRYIEQSKVNVSHTKGQLPKGALKHLSVKQYKIPYSTQSKDNNSNKELIKQSINKSLIKMLYNYVCQA